MRTYRSGGQRQRLGCAPAVDRQCHPAGRVGEEHESARSRVAEGAAAHRWHITHAHVGSEDSQRLGRRGQLHVAEVVHHDHFSLDKPVADDEGRLP